MLANLASAKDGIKSSTEYISFIHPDADTNELKEISYDGWPLIWNFYSRLLPTKITLTALGDLMNTQASLWIELGEFRVKAFDVSEELSEELRRFEQEKKLDRTKKISTGFPKPLNPNKETARLVEKRFKDKYAANIRKNTKTGEYHLEGALAALGLITVKKFLGDHYVTMTDLGKEFYQLDNPVLNGDYSHAFSNDEVKLIIEKLIPQRELEDRLCKQALKIVKTFGEYEIEQAAKLNDFFNQEFQSFVDDSSIDEIHKKRLREEFIAPSTSDTEQTPIEACRVATMGRLSELGLIKWKIGPNTSSEYTILERI